MVDSPPPSDDLPKPSDGNGETVPAAGSPRLAGSVDLKSLVSEAISECSTWIFDPKRQRRIRTGFHKLDAMTGGLRPGSLHVVASPPSAGKSTFLLNVLEEICLNQKTRSLYFCGDMAPLEVIQRFLFERGLLPRECLKAEDRQLTKADLLRIREHVDELVESGLVVMDERSPTLESIEVSAREMAKQGGIGFIALDHVHLIRSSDTTGSSKTVLTDAAVRLKSLARELGIPILVTAHLKTIPHDRPSGIHDLRHGEGLAHEADFIGILQPMGDVQGSDHVSLNIAKNHFGPCGSVDLYRHRLLLRFCEQPPLTEEEEDRILAWEQRPRDSNLNAD